MPAKEKDWDVEGDVEGAPVKTGAASPNPSTPSKTEPTAKVHAVGSLTLPTPEVAKAAEREEVEAGDGSELTEEADNFPTDLAKVIALRGELQKYRHISANPTKEQLLGHRKYLRLNKHFFELQQGPKHTHTHAGTPSAFVGLHSGSAQETRYKQKARGDIDFKRLLAERDELKKANEALAKENAEMKEILK